MKPLFLSRLYESVQPVASVYLDTSRDLDEPDRATALRWRGLRESLLAHGADEDSVHAIDHVAGRDHGCAGRHGQAVFASAGRILLDECLPEPPPRDTARYGALPHVLPLLFQRAPDVPYAAVVVHRVHPPAEAGAAAEDELELEYDLGRWPRTRVNSTAVHRRIPLTGWVEDAERLLGELAGAVGGATELVVLAGDAWAVNTMIRLAPAGLRGRFVRLRDTGLHRAEPGRAVLEHEVELLMADRLTEHDQRRLDAFLVRRAVGRRADGPRTDHPAADHPGTERSGTDGPGAAEGLAETVALLQRGQAAALFLNRPFPEPPPLWVGPRPTDLAPAAADLQAFGVGYYWEDEAGDALVRAAVGTGTDVIAVPADQAEFTDGLAALPRYGTAGTTARTGGRAVQDVTRR
ncbi:hypothetical protein ACGF07_03390 [Kitasatospora sp. NPDC048194]|uniref:baeRF2 domain-containing protein n=1 Tax=Kitasatospora sp. NPDC048194 TaxID=3364045 RepID=UPI0037166A07